MALGLPPAWATCWGSSRLGPWAGFAENHVVYRLYWCPPGAFRFPTSLAKDKVVRSAGFWMAELACTQALFESITGRNPSLFVDLNHPVESVPPEDVERFFEAFEARQPGLGLRLPTADEWLYAARAGAEEDETLVDQERWIVESDRVRSAAFESLQPSYSMWVESEVQPRGLGTTRAEACAPNPWGLRGMIGNVWERVASEDGPRVCGRSWADPKDTVGLNIALQPEAAASPAVGFRFCRSHP